jgi:threonine synthase
VRYVSTRGEAPELTFEEVMLRGLAVDGGLYVPQAWPRLPQSAIARMAGQSFAAITAAVMAPFTGRGLARRTLLRLAEGAYAGFSHPAVTPLVEIDRNLWVLELFHGPTLAFKDVAMQLLARLLDTVLAGRGEHLVMLGATSGDTGGAAIEAFRGAKRVDVVILYPEGRVSDVQRRMMTTAEEGNVHAVAIEGTFDDCQALVKAIFQDRAFRARVALAGVNSINFARIAAQIAYYFAAATALGPGRPISFAVPTGNFGNVFAGFAARRIGLADAKLLIATNDNDILARAWADGTYTPQRVLATASPSMDIQVSSNFERYLFEAAGRDPAWVRAKMEALRREGGFRLGRAQRALRRDFLAGRAGQGEVGEAIRRIKRRSGYLLDPHGACAAVVAEKFAAKTSPPVVVLAPAHPAKFPDAMEAITGERPALPARWAKLRAARERITRLPAELKRVERFIVECASAREGAPA